MTCPMCESTNVKLACCGDTTSSCRHCGYRWEGSAGKSCPLKPEAEAVEPSEPEPEHRPLTDEQLWGQ
jgi:hypothetical protein